MKGTGLEEVLELIYANNTVGQILNGKAVSRAVRAHSWYKLRYMLLLCRIHMILSYLQNLKLQKL